MNKKGFTLTELMVASGIMLIILGVVASSQLISQRLWKAGFTQITFQSTGRIALDKIAKNLRSATGAVIFDNGDRIRFTTDPNRTYNNASDDVTCEYYISGTNIMYDPNTSVSGNEVTLLRNVSKESNIPFFQVSGNLAVIAFKVYGNDALYGAHWSSMTTSVSMRNM
ncbi:MAG: prepilin-type N-terminal cleavage/methylation domain-containing protein [Candidatus Omnitrophota bacterium]|nr:prepilin-type N-terminal cleavage/methylation domain-containing protein [Candidatus Omnitrophota bacterium]